MNDFCQKVLLEINIEYDSYSFYGPPTLKVFEKWKRIGFPSPRRKFNPDYFGCVSRDRYNYMVDRYFERMKS